MLLVIYLDSVAIQMILLNLLHSALFKDMHI